MDEEHRRLILLWRWRWTAGQIAAGLGIPELMVHMAWRDDGRPAVGLAIRPVRHRARWTKEDLRYAREAFLAGTALVDIARRLGRRVHVVRRKIQKMGLRRPRTRSGGRISAEKRNLHRL